MISIRALQSGADGTTRSGSPYTVASSTIYQDRLVLLGILGSLSGGGGYLNNPTFSGGISATWSLIGLAHNEENAGTIWLYKTVLATRQVGTIEINPNGDTWLHGLWSLIEVTGIDPTQPIGQVLTVGFTGSPGTSTGVTFPGLESADNRVFAFGGTRSNDTDLVPGAGWTEIHDVNTEQRDFESQWAATGPLTNPTISWATSDVDSGMVAVEVRALSDAYEVSSDIELYERSPIDRLSLTPVINGVARVPAFLYLGGMAKGPAGSYFWEPGAGGDILDEIVQGGGTSPLLRQHSVKFQDDNVFGSRLLTTGDMGTDDIYGEAILKSPADSGTERGIIYKAPSGVDRIYLFRRSTDVLSFQIGTPGGGPIIDSVAVAFNAYLYLAWYVNRDEASTDGAQMFANASGGTGVDFSAEVATDLTIATPLLIGDGSSDQYNNEVCYLAMWRAAGMIQAGATGQAEIAALVASRFAQIEFPSY